MTPVPLCFLAGAGQTARDWAPVIATLPARRGAIAVDVGLGPDFSIRGAASHVIRELDAHDLPTVHLCGLSLGAVVAVQCALDHPKRLQSLILSAGQVRPSPVLTAVQRAVLRLLPKRLVAAGSVDKPTLLRLLEAAATVDFRGRLGEIGLRSLVLCGSRDRVNLPAARRLAAGLPDAQLRIVPGAGHAWNVTHPDLFGAAVTEFVDALPGSLAAMQTTRFGPGGAAAVT